MTRTAPPGHVRIIAGTLRGSRLPVPVSPGLRPTADRLRETLFNWLQGEVEGRRVLDLFAGTGALGLEAASRGALEVTLVERDPGLAGNLGETTRRLKVPAVRVERADALAWLGRDPEPRFDLVFLDPPFDADLWQRAAQALVPWLAPKAWVYVELARAAVFQPPPGWRLHRESSSRDVRGVLYGTESPVAAATLAGSTQGTGNAQA
jgi:16S rRNA (guanine966-N2)-methyltransferase